MIDWVTSCYQVQDTPRVNGLCSAPISPISHILPARIVAQQFPRGLGAGRPRLERQCWLVEIMRWARNIYYGNVMETWSLMEPGNIDRVIILNTVLPSRGSESDPLNKIQLIARQ